MPKRDPFKYPYTHGLPRLDTMKTTLEQGTKRPAIGVTQGGSSRRDAGCKVATKDATVRQKRV